MRSNIGSAVLVPLALAAVFCLPARSFAQDKVNISDAQVEAGVLKAFASESRLANEPIRTSTVYGTVTLTGAVSTEGARDAAEQIASRTPGVKKVIDQLVIGAPQAVAAGDDPAAVNVLPGSAAVPMSYPANGGYGPANGGYEPQGSPDGQPPYPPQGQAAPPPHDPQQPYSQQGQPPYNQQPPYGDRQQPPYGQQPYGQGSPQAGASYPDAQGGYPPPPPRRLYRRDYERQMTQGQGQGYVPQGRPGGAHVVIPGGTVLAVSINRWISSGDAAPGSTFSALVANDVLAGGEIAVPRGATVEGTVVDAKGAGALKGRGSLTLQLNALLLSGQRIPLQSDPFTVTGRDQAARSVNSTIIGAGIGALLGAAIGRGTGAAIGAGVGGAAGLGSAAASNGGQATLPPEALLRFRLQVPVPVTTVSEAEMQRLGGYAGPAAGRGGQGPYGGPYGDAYGRRGYYRGGYGY